jgi:hypothetical protein
MFLHVTDAKYVKDYKVWLRFNEGSEGVADLSVALWGKVFEPLKDPSLFQRFAVSPVLHTLAWENGADLAPEYLFSLLAHETPMQMVSEKKASYMDPSNNNQALKEQRT